MKRKQLKQQNLMVTQPFSGLPHSHKLLWWKKGEEEVAASSQKQAGTLKNDI